MSPSIRHVMIRGRVQGVGYRAWVAQQAMSVGIEGWVRNRRDGSVEALFSGPDDIVIDLVQRCHRGPISSRVDAVDEQPISADSLNLRRTNEAFSVLPTI